MNTDIYRIPVLEVAAKLGIEIQGNRGRCFNLANHKNGDRHPSIIFGIKSNVWNCPVCNFNFKYPTRSGYGSNVDLVMIYLNVDYLGALQWFGDYFGIGTEKRSKIDYKRRSFDNPIVTSKKPVQIDYTANETVYNEFLGLLGNISQESRQYLNNRGISNFIIDSFQINDITRYQKISSELKKRFDIEQLQRSGLFNDKGNFRFFKHKLIFPFLRDYSVNYIQARNITDSCEPKYLNSGTDILFPYNSNLILDNPDIEGETVYIAEGVIDCLSLIEMGYNAIGIVGTNGFKADWVKWFKGVNVVLALDNDKAGKGAIRKIADMFAAEFIRVKSISPADFPQFDACKDWNDILTRIRNNN